MQLDLPLLSKEREKKPNDTRVAFYLAQTYDLIEDRDQALKTYQERIDMGGWQQEVFEAHVRRVGCCCLIVPLFVLALQLQFIRGTPEVHRLL